VKAVLEPLLQSPELPEYVDSLNRILALERRSREKFYEELTEDGKFEFINGQVIMHSPATRKHINVTKNLSRLLSTFAEERGLGEAYAEKALCVFPRNDYEPDISAGVQGVGRSRMWPRRSICPPRHNRRTACRR
jgi:Uma2 family endonuclease